MADTKLADLTATTAPAATDIFYIVVDPGGTPLDRKVTLANLGNALWPLDHTGATAATDALTLDVTGDTQLRLVVNHDGSMEFGSGAVAADIKLYRSAANTVMIQSLTGTHANFVIKGAGGGTATLSLQRDDGAVQFSVGSDGSVTMGNGIAQFSGNSSGVLRAIATNAAAVPLFVRGAASQTANLAEWQSSASAVLFSIDATGFPKWIAAKEQTTVGLFGGASALPATPTKYLQIKDSAGTTLVIPAYAA